MVFSTIALIGSILLSGLGTAASSAIAAEDAETRRRNQIRENKRLREEEKARQDKIKKETALKMAPLENFRDKAIERYMVLRGYRGREAQTALSGALSKSTNFNKGLSAVNRRYINNLSSSDLIRAKQNYARNFIDAEATKARNDAYSLDDRIRANSAGTGYISDFSGGTDASTLDAKSKLFQDKGLVKFIQDDVNEEVDPPVSEDPENEFIVSRIGSNRG